MNSQAQILQKEINRKHKDVDIYSIDGTSPIDNVARIPTGLPTLDAILNGGLPDKPVFVEFFGEESSGKSHLACICASKIQETGRVVLYIDAEGSLDPDYISNIGIQSDKFLFTQESGAEKIMKLVNDVVAMPSPPGLIVIDSIAALVPEDEEPDKQSIASLARILGRSLRDIQKSNNETIILLVNQVRESIGPYASVTTPGGRALRHWASVRLEIRRGQRIKRQDAPQHKKHLAVEDDAVVGHHMNVRVIKSKACHPFGITRLNYYIDGRIDYLEDMMKQGIINGKIKRSGPWYTIDEQKLRGRDAVLEILDTNEEIQKYVMA